MTHSDPDTPKTLTSLKQIRDGILKSIKDDVFSGLKESSPTPNPHLHAPLPPALQLPGKRLKSCTPENQNANACSILFSLEREKQRSYEKQGSRAPESQGI